MNTRTRLSGARYRFLAAVITAALMMLPVQALGTHPAGGSCKHDGGLYSICAPKQGGKKCTRGTQKGRCSQHAKGCTCDLGTAAMLENAITDIRESFDVILASDELPPLPLPGLACQQVAVVVDHLQNAMPVVLPLIADPDFVSTGFLAEIDSLLRDLQDVESIANGCSVPLPPPLGPAIVDLKSNYLNTFSELLE